MPRPTRLRAWRAPDLSEMLLSFMAFGPSCPAPSRRFDDADEMGHLGDHAAHRRRVLERRPAVELVQAETDQRRLLALVAPRRAPDLLHRHCLLGLGLRHFSRFLESQPCSGTASPSRRRAMISLTFLPRRAATERGLVSRFSASNVARTML